MTAPLTLYYLPVHRQGYDADLDQWLSLLNPEELARYQRYKVAHARQAFLQGRRMLKTLLGQRLGCAPGAVHFSYNPHGKPYLAGQPRLHFNLSHCDAALALVIGEVEVGVDVEAVARCERLWDKAGEFLNAHVVAQIAACSGDEAKAACFATHWSCMESYVKLLGSGIFHEREQVRVSPCGPGANSARLRYADARFSSFHFDPAVRIAVASFARFYDIEVLRWQQGQLSAINPD